LKESPRAGAPCWRELVARAYYTITSPRWRKLAACAQFKIHNSPPLTPYHPLTIPLPSPYHPLTIPLPSPYHPLIFPLPSAYHPLILCLRLTTKLVRKINHQSLTIKHYFVPLPIETAYAART